MSDTSFEYAIEVGNRGYLQPNFGTYKVGPEPQVCEDVAVADEVMAAARKFFLGIAAPEIAHSLHLVTRAVTITRSEWTREAGIVSTSDIIQSFDQLTKEEMIDLKKKFSDGGVKTIDEGRDLT
jgi:hypothetical protein